MTGITSTGVALTSDQLAEELANRLALAYSPGMAWFLRGVWDGINGQPFDASANLYRADYRRGYDAGKLQDAEGTP